MTNRLKFVMDKPNLKVMTGFRDQLRQRINCPLVHTLGWFGAGKARGAGCSDSAFQVNCKWLQPYFWHLVVVPHPCPCLPAGTEAITVGSVMNNPSAVKNKANCEMDE